MTIEETKKPLYPELVVDLSKCEDTWDVEGKVHGQMKHHYFDKKLRQQFTKEVQACETWDCVIDIAQKWVTIKEAR